MTTPTSSMFESRPWFKEMFEAVEASPIGQSMKQTVEGSEWHRESSTWRHTEMCLEHYFSEVAPFRTQRQIDMTALCLLAHDFGKPEAEETVERKDGSGSYHRYAGHEPVSANEFISFMCSHKELTETFFDQGFSWGDIRKIKFMIEHHLPFGMTNKQKRNDLKQAVLGNLGDDELCFYDQLYSDCCGRISDNHEDKKEAVRVWIEEFKALEVPAAPKFNSAKILDEGIPVMFVLIGAPGIGKSTWTKGLDQSRMFHGDGAVTVVSEDNYRLEFAEAHLTGTISFEGEHVLYKELSPKKKYAAAWAFCFDHSADYDKYAAKQLMDAVSSGNDLVLDRTNLTRKSRGKWIQAAKQAKYQIVAIEFYQDESTVLDRQSTRGDKAVPLSRVRQMYMSTSTAWFPVEVDAYNIERPW